MSPRFSFALRRRLLGLAVALLTVAATGVSAPATGKNGEEETDNPAVLALLSGLSAPQSITIPWRRGRFAMFQTGSTEEHGVVARNGALQARLYPAPGQAPAAYAVLLAGCGNTYEGANDLWLKLWARYLQEIGVGAVALDSFGPRGVHDVCGDPSKTWAIRRVDDAHSALTWLISQPFADAKRVFVIGMSNGARTALLSVSATENWRFHRFAAAVALYPACDRMPPHNLLAPTMVLLGAADDVATPEVCTAFVTARRASAHPPQLTVYPHASHLFDVFPRDDNYTVPEVVDARARVLAFLQHSALPPDPSTERLATPAQ